jgi:RNA-directed DNA polymerase
MMEILHEKGLSLSRKKSRIGCISHGFHFLGVDYPPTRTEDNIKEIPANDDSIAETHPVHYLTNRGG